MISDNVLLDAALGYAARGWHIVPLHSVANGTCTCSKRDDCPSPGKHPRTAHGLKDASSDEQVVRGWWSRWPEANIGILTGAESGIVVVDIDGPKGAQSLAELQQTYGDLPDTFTAKSGRVDGGFHFYFAHPGKSVQSTNGRIGEKLDIRGDGGYIIAPPSLHASGNRYTVLADIDLAPLPEWIIAANEPPPARPTPPPSQHRHAGNGAADNRVERARRYLGKMPPAISGQGGHNATFAAATALVHGFELSMDDARALLQEYNLRCQPAWSESDLEHKLQDAAGKPHREPRGWLLNAERKPSPGNNGRRFRMTDTEIISDGPATATATEQEPEPEAGHDGEGEQKQEPDEGLVALGDRDPDSGRLVLSPKRIKPTGDAWVRDSCTHADARTLIHYAGMFMAWDGSRWVEVADDAFRAKLLPWLHDALRYVMNRKTEELMLVDFEANTATTAGALDALRMVTHLPASTPIGEWWVKWKTWSPPAAELLPCKSMLLHIPSGRTLPATPALFNVNALEFDPDPSAPAPVAWLKFLASLWPTDPEQISTLQEWFGYCLTADTKQQKMLLLIGPKRSGKGTIARMLRRLVGDGNVCGPTTTSLSGPFGLQPLVGKSLAIVSDARFSGENIMTAVERLLCISGEDAMTVERKFQTAVTLKLPTRFMFLSNELPRFSDAAGALVGRFIMLLMTESWFGKEDHGLEARLIPELPGILNWAMEGWKRLNARGRFVMPAAVETHLRQFEELASPITAFIRDRCQIGPGRRAYVDELFRAWSEWCKAQGRDHPGSVNNFGRDLLAAEPQLVQKRNHGVGRFYEGISLESQNA